MGGKHSMQSDISKMPEERALAGSLPVTDPDLGMIHRIHVRETQKQMEEVTMY